MRQLWEVADFVRKAAETNAVWRVSRAPLRAAARRIAQCRRVECDWIARPADDWDSNCGASAGPNTSRCRRWQTRSPCAISFLMRSPILNPPCCGAFVNPRASLPS